MIRHLDAWNFQKLQVCARTYMIYIESFCYTNIKHTRQDSHQIQRSLIEVIDYIEQKINNTLTSLYENRLLPVYSSNEIVNLV